MYYVVGKTQDSCICVQAKHSCWCFTSRTPKGTRRSTTTLTPPPRAAELLLLLPAAAAAAAAAVVVECIAAAAVPSLEKAAEEVGPTARPCPPLLLFVEEQHRLAVAT